MHRIIKAHLDSFATSFGLDCEEEEIQFDKFANYAVISSPFSASYEIADVTTGLSQDGIDGIAVIIDEEVSVSLEDAEAVFGFSRRNHDVDIIFVQAKRSEYFDLGDFMKFKEAILRFATQTPLPTAMRCNRNARQIFDVVLREVPKIRNGKPSLTARFVTTSVYFLSLRPINKMVEQYFNTYENTDGRLYLERRDRQYVGQDIPVIRIFSLHIAMKCLVAMYCNRPDLAFRYPKQMYAELADTIFADATKEGIFYAACLTLYRFNLLISNSTIPQNMKRFK